MKLLGGMADITSATILLFITLSIIGVSSVMYIENVHAANLCRHGSSDSSRCSKNHAPFIFPFP